MEQKILGHSHVKISPIILGAWAIGGWMWGGTDEKDSVEAIQKSLEAGANTIDTAAIYGMGLSEEIVGKAIKGKRDKVVIATKCGLRWDSREGSEPWIQTGPDGKPLAIRRNSKPDSIRHECAQSLKRLGVDFIDLYQIHAPDSSTPIEESWKTMMQLKEEGKVRAIGVSNYSLEQLERAHKIYPVDSIQPAYSLLRRDIEKDLLPFCKKNQISVLVYSPLERGLLSGKVSMNRTFPEGDHRIKHPYFSPENRKIVLDALEKIAPLAKKLQVTLAQIISSCTLEMPGITAIIVGARNGKQAIENAQAGNLKLSKEDKDFIVQTLAEARSKLSMA